MLWRTNASSREKIHKTNIIYSKTKNKLYVGYSDDLKRRIQEHKRGEVKTTSKARDWRLVYFEACLSQKDALDRERQLKTGFGRAYLKRRLKNYFISLGQ